MSKSTTSSQDESGDRSGEEGNEDPDIAKIKKVQSFFRGWLCRRRWKQIVDEYIRSPHAESMRKRNWLVHQNKTKTHKQNFPFLPAKPFP